MSDIRSSYALLEFETEMDRAIEKYPDSVHLPNGTGGQNRKALEMLARMSCDRAYAEGKLTHSHILDEEACEVLAAENDDDVRKELVQVGAMCLKWILDIDSRKKT
jgi:hypothetical protein